MSYEDNGISITNIYRVKGGNFSNELGFKTKYVKNKALYFEWLEMPDELEKQIKIPPGFTGLDLSKPKKSALIKDNNGVQINYSFKEKVMLKSLSIALSSATGVSSGLAWMVPCFLSPEIPCHPNLDATYVTIIRDTKDVVSIELTLDNGTLGNLPYR